MEAEPHDVRCDFVREARTREYFLEQNSVEAATRSHRQAYDDLVDGSPQFVVTSAPTQHDDETVVTRGTWDVSFFADVTDSRGGDTLDLSRRHIGHLELPRGLRGMFPRLHTLDISHNKLVRLPIEIATQLPALRVFDCSRNVLESLEPGTRIASLPLPAALVRVRRRVLFHSSRRHPRGAF